MTRKKILAFLITGLAYGGAETQLVRVATKLRARGWEVSVISIISPRAFVGELEASGIRVMSLGINTKSSAWSAFPKMVILLRRLKPLVLTSFMYHANLLGRVSGRLAGVPIIVSSIRNEKFGGANRDLFMSSTNWLDDCVTTNSRLAGEALVQRGVVSRQHLRIIPNGIAVEHYQLSSQVRDRTRVDLKIPEKGFLWLAAGRLEHQKDYFTMLEAFRQAISEHPDAYLRIAGQGYLKDEVEAKVHSFGLGHRVELLGLRTDMPALLAAADGLVLSSAWEGLPNVVMEAMAAGKPVVATSVGGTPELVQEGVSGFLVPPGSPNVLADAMSRLMILTEADRYRMGENGYRHIVEHYGSNRIVDMWERLYADLIYKKGLK